MSDRNFERLTVFNTLDLGYSEMTMKEPSEFDFDDFLDRCTNEFMELELEPRFIAHGTGINYAPTLPVGSEWQETGDSVLRQVQFAAPFLYKQDVGYGIINFDRPVLAIKFGEEFYWRTVPKRHIAEAIEEAKRRKVYAEITVQPMRKADSNGAKGVMEFVNRCYGKVIQGNYAHFPFIKIKYKDKPLTLRFDKSCIQQLDFTVEHLAAGGSLDKIFEIAHWLTSGQSFDFGFSGVDDLLTLHIRCDNMISLFQCPDSLVPAAHGWAEKHQKLIASPYAIVNKKVSTIGSR